ncbi:polysaccharide pyruvyl transferase family protein [Alkalimonas amylolytica]|uniref:Colanic acid/amylovoran biosynthesis protein n=1 Tax=Alkalimonas amylolytica TaxID=152573 RepID=A0A1H3ZXY8_ALKAM|nr:polysaccharide pyruvyl transferase family protein [Alkalimonas amylolytica]SEA28577.1 colanic acid/amylovoran biosynthesis protein [Alkalimonas amylolytica]
MSHKPYRIEIKGVQFRNKGAYLMLLACLQGLQPVRNMELVLSPGPNLPYPERARLGAWQKLAFRRKSLDLTGWISRLPGPCIRLFNRYGMVTERQVDAVLEASGFAYGDQWPLQFLQNTAREVERFAKAGKPFIFMPQAFGPFKSEASKTAMRTIIQHARLIFVRDAVSKQHLESCLSPLPAHVIQSPDFTIGLTPEAVPKADAPYAALIPNNKVISPFHHANANQLKDDYLAAFVQAAEQLHQAGYQVKLVNHEGKEDAELCQHIQARAQHAEVIEMEDPLAVKAYIGGASLVVSSRFHGAINALSQGVPCIATSWSHKYRQMMQDFGMEEYCIETLTPGSLQRSMTQLLANQQAITAQLKQTKEALHQQNLQMWQRIYQQLPVN